ncbi:CU044_5270 family protein [Actinoplanes bogorensis]|uniref:CU044_5270 family protein n=1 Tax=Paractinoplanes bogorensis TaxID=1610840 RepID=A0ABS5YGB3_9ACTN|nr:CU044_5270 family protein [Actinoplanes bogorensis]MBU2662426.1 CU044_5270 family protein [Actinoplanes bogorensis]
MNDLDLMEKFRADVAPPDPAALARARAGMFRAEPAPRRRWVWRLAPVAALASVVAAGVTVVALRGPDSPPPAPEAVRVLRLAAAEARRDPVLPARPDQYVYIESRVAWAGATMVSPDNAQYIPPVEKNRRIWLSVDGTRDGLLDEQAVRPSEAGRDTIHRNTPLPVQGTPIPAYLRNLPTEATAMRNWLYAGTGATKEGGNPPDVTAFVKVGDTLREQYVPPASAAALFEAAATIPGTTVVKQQVDLAGRRGIAVSKVHHATRHDLIFDARTYRFLGEREVAQEDAAPFPAGAVIGWTAQLQVAVVDKAGQRP